MILLVVMALFIVALPTCAVGAIWLVTKPERELQQALAAEQIRRSRLQTDALQHEMLAKQLDVGSTPVSYEQWERENRDDEEQ